MIASLQFRVIFGTHFLTLKHLNFDTVSPKRQLKTPSSSSIVTYMLRLPVFETASCVCGYKNGRASGATAVQSMTVLRSVVVRLATHTRTTSDQNDYPLARFQ